MKQQYSYKKGCKLKLEKNKIAGQDNSRYNICDKALLLWLSFFVLDEFSKENDILVNQCS